MMAEGTIFDIKKYAIHDGPGIRSTVFFKGCPLACRWCHNPEGMTVASQRIYRQERCIGCGECIQFCPHEVMTQTAEGIVADLAKCDLCQTCADHCPSEAVEFVGRKVTVVEVIREIEKDIAFYDESGGGITLSGGTLLNQRFLPDVLQGEDGIEKLCQLIRTYFNLNGHHIQFNIVDSEILRRAQRKPHEYRDLLVRVAGYSDYFVDLDTDHQEEIIARTQHDSF